MPSPLIYLSSLLFVIFFPLSNWASLMAQTVKCLTAMQETWVQSLGQEDPLEKEMATHSSILARKIPWTEDPGRLQSIGLQRVWTGLSDFTSSFQRGSLKKKKKKRKKERKKDFQRGSLVISKVKRKGSSLILKKLRCQNMGRVSSCCPGEVLERHFSCPHLGSWTVGELSNSLRDSSLLKISSIYIIPFILKVLCKH